MDLHRRPKLITTDIKERHLKSVLPFEKRIKKLEKSQLDDTFSHNFSLRDPPPRSPCTPARAPSTPERADVKLRTMYHGFRGVGDPVGAPAVLPGTTSPLAPRLLLTALLQHSLHQLILLPPRAPRPGVGGFYWAAPTAADP